jgi:hypothetical protein
MTWGVFSCHPERSEGSHPSRAILRGGSSPTEIHRSQSLPQDDKGRLITANAAGTRTVVRGEITGKFEFQATWPDSTVLLAERQVITIVSLRGARQQL